jgi:dCMP deaminase
MKRLSSDQYYMEIAYATSRRSTCPRASVGAIVVSDDVVVSTGYNGAPKGLLHCDEVGCILEAGKCTRVVHAEANAILKNVVKGCKLYTTHKPCLQCCNLIINSGIKVVYWSEDYNDIRCTLYGVRNQDEYLSMTNIEIVHLKVGV